MDNFETKPQGPMGKHRLIEQALPPQAGSNLGQSLLEIVATTPLNDSIGVEV